MEVFAEFGGERGVAAQLHAAHAFDAAADGDIDVARRDGLGGEVDGLLSGAAKPVYLQPGNLDGEPGFESRQAADIGALFADRRDAPGDDVIDMSFLEPRSPNDRVERTRQEIDGVDRVQRAVLLAAPDGRAHRFHDIYVP